MDLDSRLSIGFILKLQTSFISSHSRLMSACSAYSNN